MKHKNMQQSIQMDIREDIEEDVSLLSDNIDKKMTISIEDSKDSEKDWDIDVAYSAGYLSTKKPNKKVDWCAIFDNNWAVHRQKEGTYSCIGYATTDMVHLYLHQKGYKIDRLSARFNWIASKEIDEFTNRPTTFIDKAGSTLKASLDVCRKYGSVEDYLLPTDESGNFQGTTQQFYAQAAKYKILSYYSLMLSKEIKQNPAVSIEQEVKLQTLIWKKWLSENGPILVKLDVDFNFYSARGRILKTYGSNEAYQKHAVLIVGFNDDGFKIRNSWGAEWGDKGYIWVSYDYAFQAIDEAYGITMPNSEVGNPAPTEAPEKSLIDYLWGLIVGD